MLFSANGCGNLTDNCVVKTTTEKSKLVQFSMASNERVKNTQGEWEDRPSFYTVKLWMPKASTLDTFLVKGKTVQVSGALLQERWEKDGKNFSTLVIDSSNAGHGIALFENSRANMLMTVFGAGHLTDNAVVKFSNDRSKQIQFTVATNERIKNAQGEWTDRASFYIVKIWLPKESTLDTYLVKGKAVQVSGFLVQERWEKDGQKNSMYVIDASAAGHGVNLLGSKKESEEGSSTPTKPTSNKTAAPKAKTPALPIEDDEIPF